MGESISVLGICSLDDDGVVGKVDNVSEGGYLGGVGGFRSIWSRSFRMIRGKRGSSGLPFVTEEHSSSKDGESPLLSTSQSKDPLHQGILFVDRLRGCFPSTNVSNRKIKSISYYDQSLFHA
jgi:hypothetical protein